MSPWFLQEVGGKLKAKAEKEDQRFRQSGEVKIVILEG